MDKLLLESGGALLQESGDLILLTFTYYRGKNVGDMIEFTDKDMKEYLSLDMQDVEIL